MVKARLAAAFKKTEPGVNNAKRSAPDVGMGIKLGASCATTSASTPTTFKALRLPSAEFNATA